MKPLAETAGHTVSSLPTSPDRLIQRLAAEVTVATERIHVILRPCIEAFTKVHVFKGIKPDVSLLSLIGMSFRQVHSGTIVPVVLRNGRGIEAGEAERGTRD